MSRREDHRVADETMRRDPARKAAVADAIAARQAAFRTAKAKVAEAVQAFTDLGYDTLHDDVLVERAYRAVADAHSRLRNDAPFVLSEPNDTYLGNKAAFGQPTGWTPAEQS